ncbi:MAG: MarC family protein [bacterium]
MVIFWQQVLKVFIALFIITDSVGNLPFFMGMTDGLEKKERRSVFFSALLTGLFLLALFGFAGFLIFDIFDLTINDLRIAGGILLFMISIEIMFRGRFSVEHKEDVGVVPLGCPLLVGPGAITTVIMMGRIYEPLAVVVGVLLCFTLIWLILFFAERLFKLLGHNGSLIVTKIFAIIMAGIAVKFVRQGVQAIFGI